MKSSWCSASYTVHVHDSNPHESREGAHIYGPSSRILVRNCQYLHTELLLWIQTKSQGELTPLHSLHYTMSDRDEAIRSHRRRRDVASSSLTKIVTSTGAIERLAERSTTTLASLKRELELKEATADFKTNHLAIVDLVNDDELDAEQAILNEQDDKVARLTSLLHQLITECEEKNPRAVPARTGTINRHLTKRLTYIQQKVEEIATAVDAALTAPDVDTCLLSQYDSQLSDTKSDIACVSRDILSLETEDPALSALESELRKTHFEIVLKIRRSMQNQAKTPTTTDGSIKLPRLDVPTFDGNLYIGGHFGNNTLSLYTHASCSPTLRN